MKANRKIKNIKADKSGYMQVVGGLVALLLLIIVGIMLFWEVSDSIELNSSDANDSKNKTTDMATTVFSLLPIIALAAVASIIIGVIIGFGGGAPRT
jgi:ABC-type anion transport system duplicated permease subunit